MEGPLTVRAAVLQALRTPGSGRELRARIREATAGLMHPSPGSLYPALAALEAEGLVRRLRSSRRDGGAGRPEIAYDLTVRGVAAAMADREAITRMTRAGSETRTVVDATVLSARLVRGSRVAGDLASLRRAMRTAR